MSEDVKKLLRDSVNSHIEKQILGEGYVSYTETSDPARFTFEGLLSTWNEMRAKYEVTLGEYKICMLDYEVKESGNVTLLWRRRALGEEMKALDFIFIDRKEKKALVYIPPKPKIEPLAPPFRFGIGYLPRSIPITIQPHALICAFLDGSGFDEEAWPELIYRESEFFDVFDLIDDSNFQK